MSNKIKIIILVLVIMVSAICGYFYFNFENPSIAKNNIQMLYDSQTVYADKKTLGNKGEYESDGEIIQEQGDKININTASKSRLDELPNVGEKTAQNIIDYREVNGEFKNIEDIMNVSGIGIKKFEQMKDMITIE